MVNALSWFEIPTTELDRAVKFYETVLAVSFRREVFGGVAMAMFPHGDKSPGGALIQDARRKPAPDGVLIYLDTQGHLDACIARIAKATWWASTRSARRTLRAFASKRNRWRSGRILKGRQALGSRPEHAGAVGDGGPALPSRLRKAHGATMVICPCPIPMVSVWTVQK